MELHGPPTSEKIVAIVSAGPLSRESGWRLARSTLRRQPAIPALGQAPEGTREWAGNPGFSRIRFRLWTPTSPRLRQKSPKVSGLLGKYSRFTETIGGDWFGHDCRLRAALPAGPEPIRFLTKASQS